MEFDKKLKLHSGTRKAEIISRKWYRISFSVLLIGLVGMLAGAYLGIRTGIFWPCAVFLLLMLTSVPLVKIMCRCPCCGCAKHTKLLCWSGFNEMYCSKCGAVLKYDDDPDKDRDLDELEAEKAREEWEALEEEEQAELKGEGQLTEDGVSNEAVETKNQ